MLPYTLKVQGLEVEMAVKEEMVAMEVMGAEVVQAEKEVEHELATAPRMEGAVVEAEMVGQVEMRVTAVTVGMVAMVGIFSYW